MEASDMLDVIHFLYEEDLRYSNVEEAQWLDTKRQHIYKELYGEDYKYFSTKRTGSDDLISEDGEVVKPYIPPTEFDPDSSNPFGSVLDAPAN
jgi:hypothetical protein